jgi:ketosteroid isomerase-like protein
MANPDAAKIAEILRTEFEASPGRGMAAMGSFFADVIEQRHVPPGPTDGLTDGKQLREGHALHANATAEAPGSETAGTVRAEGNKVIVEIIGRGSLKSGEAYVIKTEIVLEVLDGKIVVFEARQSPEDRALTWKVSAEMMAAAGMTIPADYREQGGLEIPPDILEAFREAGVAIPADQEVQRGT